MTAPEQHRFRPPINYRDVRRTYSAVRAAAGLVIGTASAIAWTLGAPSGPYAFAAGLLLTAHALYERNFGTSALAPLLTDATLIGVLSIARGHSAAIEGAGLVYVVTGAMLLLPLRRAFAVIGYAALWVVPVALFAEYLPQRSESVLGDLGATIAFAAVVAQLLYATGQALIASEERHRNALEAERRAVELKDEFVSMVSHELRTPLTSIGGFAETLRENWKGLPPNEVDEFLLIMRREASHLSNLVEDILVIPRLEAGRLRLEPEVIVLRDEAFEVSRLVFAGTTRELQVDIPIDVAVLADPNRLRQIFRNLLENARKYGGDQVLITGERLTDTYKVVIADNGPGIPVDDRNRIFEHFEQAVKGDARSEGVGLGLPIARKLVRAMGGDLWFEPRFPTGAQFLFTVETAAVPAPTEAAEASDEPGSPTTGTTPATGNRLTTDV